MSEHNATSRLIVALRNEIARLHADASGKALVIACLTEELADARKALEPFARNVNATSIGGALGHIAREHLFAARDALRALSHPTTEPAKAEEPDVAQ